jgi:hypothetical protein
MAGVKGKSGKVTTPEARASRRLSGQHMQRQKKINDEARRALARSQAELSNDDAEAAGTFDVACWADRKDQLECVLKIKKNRLAEIDIEKAQAELARARGDLITREELRERDAAHDKIIQDHLDTVVTLASSLVSPEKALAAQTSARAWITQVRTAIAAQLDEAAD